jgi:hypothetical protein
VEWIGRFRSDGAIFWGAWPTDNLLVRHLRLFQTTLHLTLRERVISEVKEQMCSSA